MVLSGEGHSRRPRKDLVRLSLETALELDRLRRGKGANRLVIDAFEHSLKAPRGPEAGRLYLSDSPRAEDAYYRAARGMPGFGQPLDELKRELVRILDEIRPALQDPDLVREERVRLSVAKLETFCMNLHEALSTERSLPRRFAPHRAPKLEADVG